MYTDYDYSAYIAHLYGLAEIFGPAETDEPDDRPLCGNCGDPCDELYEYEGMKICLACLEAYENE